MSSQTDAFDDAVFAYAVVVAAAAVLFIRSNEDLYVRCLCDTTITTHQ